jgi:hypothetical protein
MVAVLVVYNVLLHQMRLLRSLLGDLQVLVYVLQYLY